MPTLEINVILGMQTVMPPILGSVPTTVDHDPSTSHANSPVMWNFQSLDPGVDSVEIAFQDPSDTYFPSRSGGAATNCVAKLTTGYASIWGTTPHLKKHGVHPSKYTIKAYDSNGVAMPLYELDPTVVTVDP